MIIHIRRLSKAIENNISVETGIFNETINNILKELG